MSDPRDPVEMLLSSLQPPEPPASLRSSALARAEAAWAQPATPDRWRQIWESRPLRLAWATAVAALAAANLALPSRSGRGPGGAPPPDVAASAVQDRELRDVVQLPRLREAYVAMEAARPAAAPHRVDTPDLDKEKTS